MTIYEEPIYCPKCGSTDNKELQQTHYSEETWEASLQCLNCQHGWFRTWTKEEREELIKQYMDKQRARGPGS